MRSRDPLVMIEEGEEVPLGAPLRLPSAIGVVLALNAKDPAVPADLRPWLEDFERQVIEPLRSAPSGAEWVRRADRLTLTAGILQLKIASQVWQAPEGRTWLTGLLEQHPSPELRRPLEVKARGAARFALDVYVWVAEVALKAVEELPEDELAPMANEAETTEWLKQHLRAREQSGLSSQVDQMLLLELGLLTLIGEQEPVPGEEVAVEAAWEAYSHARSLSRQFAAAGYEVPVEQPAEARERAAQLVSRVAARWSSEVAGAVEAARWRRA